MTDKKDNFPKPDRPSSAKRPTLFLPDGTPYFSSTHDPDRGPTVTETDFVEFDDGRIAELVQDPSDPTRTQLAVWNDGSISYASKLQSHGRVFVPLRLEGDFVQDVLLPSAAEPYGSIRDLVGEVGAVMLRTVCLSDLDRAVLTFFVLYSWVADRLPVAVYLSVFGPPGSGKTTLLGVLRLLCRRSLLTSDVSSAAFYGACDRIKPTLLLDEWTSKSDLCRLLRASHTRASDLVMRRDRSYHVFGAKVIASLEPLDDSALNSRCILLPMTEATSYQFLALNDPHLLEIAARVRKHLLQFRLEHLKRIRPAKIQGVDHLRSRDQNLLSSLAAPIAENEEWCQGLLSFFKQQIPSKERALSAAHRTVLEILFLLAHTGATGIIVQDFANLLNAELCRKNEPYGLHPRKVGYLLSSLGFSFREPTRKGLKVPLDKAYRKRIHALVRNHRIQLPLDVHLRIEMSSCRMCRELGLCYA